MKERATNASQARSPFFTIRHGNIATVYASRASAEAAIHVIAKLGVDTEKLSIVAMDHATGNEAEGAPEFRRLQGNESLDGESPILIP